MRSGSRNFFIPDNIGDNDYDDDDDDGGGGYGDMPLGLDKNKNIREGNTM